MYTYLCVNNFNIFIISWLIKEINLSVDVIFIIIGKTNLRLYYYFNCQIRLKIIINIIDPMIISISKSWFGMCSKSKGKLKKKRLKIIISSS